MRGFIKAIALILTSVLFFQCQREVSFKGTPDPVVVLPDPITAILQGNVLDENGQPASGVNIKVGSKTATTDAKGYFRITAASLDKYVSLVTAEKTGYFKAYRTFSATSGTNQVVIKLVKRNLGGTVSGTSGGDVSLSNGTKISLPANGIVNASTGVAYTGTINVFASYIDPSSADIDQTVPGSFMANDQNGRRVTLSSYGMVAVELESTTGEKLQIKSGSTATLTTSIPSSLQSSAPATIALWSVDEQTGLWKEEGTATKQGNLYVGQVSHFSFWNCDISIPAVTVSMTIKNSDGQPLVHARVKISRTNNANPSYAYGYTDSLGQVSGLVPANENLRLDVLDQCNNSIYNQNIGPFLQNTNIGALTITGAGTASVVTVKGRVLNCSAANVTNGYAIVTLNNWVHYASVDANGNFSTSYILCSNGAVAINVLGVDATALQQGNLYAFNYPSASGTINIGDITACGTSATQFVTYTLDGTNYSITAPADSLVAYTTGMGGSATGPPYMTSINGMQNTSSGSSIYFTFTHPNTTPGTYPMATLQVQNYMQPTLANSSNVVITNYPTAIGQFYEGTFSASFTSGGTHTISGTFKVRKNF